MSQTVHGHAGKLSERTGFVTPMLERPILNTKHQTPNTKHQTPNTKHQAPNTRKAQLPNFKFRRIPSVPSPDTRSGPASLGFGYLDFFGVWCLVFGVW